MVQIRNLILVLGDQLDLDAPMIQSIDAGRDVVWMAEVDENRKRFGPTNKELFYFYRRCGILRKPCRIRAFRLIIEN